jgi:hypothetical protein
MQLQPVLDRPATAARLADGLLISISFLTTYGTGAFFQFLQLNESMAALLEQIKPTINK